MKLLFKLYFLFAALIIIITIFRAILAQRNKNRLEFEEMVKEINLERQQKREKEAKTYETPNITIESSIDDLLSAIKCKDDHIMELTNKLQQLEANVLDLKENVKEKDCVIDARTKANKLITEGFNKRVKNSLDLLNDTKYQMRKMQEKFVGMEHKMLNENRELQAEIVFKKTDIRQLEQKNSNLESSNLELQARLTSTTTELNEFKSLCSEKDNQLKELQNRLSEKEENIPTPQSSPEKTAQDSPHKTIKRKVSKKTKATETSSCTDHITRISELEKIIEEKTSEVEKLSSIAKKENVEPTEEEKAKLSKQLEEMNKNMIKMKAQYKAKLKEMQKKTTPADFAKKISTLESDAEKLEHRVADLEEEKGNLQLKLVDYEANKGDNYILFFRKLFV